MEKESYVLNKDKAAFRISINLTLLGIAFTLFGLTINLKPELLFNSIFLTYQLVLSIPFLISSILARTKMPYGNFKKWDRFGFITFIIGYSALINSVGLILSNFVSNQVSIIFFLANVLLAVIYSIVQVSCERNTLVQRIYQDLIFVILITLFGILPVLKIY